MTAYSPDWLDLRAGADGAARAEALAARLAARLAGPCRIVDLGAGSGANARCLAPRLAGPQYWQLVDHDAALLERARAQCRALVDGAGRPVAVATSTQDLATTANIDFGQTDLVTASALLDLVSERWLGELVERVRQAGCVALLVLSYDGRIEWHPRDSADPALRTAFNEHQRAQCHFGEPALGSVAAARAIDAFTRAGYEVESAPSDWVLGEDHAQLLHALVDGWVAAASEQEPASAARFARWGALRREQIAAGGLRATVGHRDLLALPGAQS